ncbi:MAG: hypothetical protein H6Q13_3474 [Bacteroidetes bacterium]|nr:hypothetical protein [Bacteroidota bacterium]
MEELPKKLTERGIKVIEGAVDKAEYYSVKEAAEILGVTTKTVRNRIEGKVLLAVFHDVGPGQSQYLIPKSSVNIPTTITKDVVALSRAISVPELIQSIKGQIREEFAAEFSAIKEGQEELKAGQARLESVIKERDEKLMETVRNIQALKERSSFWSRFWHK